MSTQINVTVGASRLVDQSRSNQQANRSQFVEAQQQQAAEQESRAKVEAERLRIAQAREAAVQEYGIDEETSAQRNGGMGAWLDVNTVYKPFKNETFTPTLRKGYWVEDDALQVSVAPAGGKGWVTETLYCESGIKGGTGDTEFSGGTDYDGFLTFVQSFPLANAISELPPGAEETPYDPRIYVPTDNSENQELFFDRNKLISIGPKRVTSGVEDRRIATYIVLPVDDNTAIIVAPVFIGWVTSEIVQAGAEPPGDLFAQVPEGPARVGVRYIKYFKVDPSEVNGEDRWIVIWGWYELRDNENNLILSLSEFGIEQTGPFAVNKAARDNLCFVVNNKKARRIPLPSAAAEKINQRFPDYVLKSILGGFTYALPDSFSIDYWDPSGSKSWTQIPGVSSMGASASRVPLATENDGQGPFYGKQDDFRAPTYLFGSPGVYDYFDADLNDYDLANWFFDDNFAQIGYLPGKVVSSAYASPSTPLFAPDHTVPNSGFEYLSAFDNNTGHALTWSFMKPVDRAAGIGIYTEASPSVSWLSAVPSAHPAFYFSYFTQTISGVEFDLAKQYAWVSAVEGDKLPSGYMKQSGFATENAGWRRYNQSIKLSPSRTLPPSLLFNNPARTLHPYVDLTSPYLTLVSWTGWGRNWRSQLTALGFSSADLNP